jgi:two-component system, OmpR family, sensor histidine kinase KdpD
MEPPQFTPNVAPELAAELVALLDGSLRIEDFVATLVHETAQPLVAIQFLATALRTAGDTISADKRAELLLAIEGQAKFLHDLSKWMVTPFARETIEFDELLALTAANCRPLAPDHKVVFEPGAAGALVACETVRVEASIRNLVRNSATYSPQGSQITIRTFAAAEMAVATVVDAGSGIPHADWERIFLPYAQLHGDRQAATGLGLFIVRSCAKQHDGYARVAASGPDGTTMELALRALTETEMRP